MINKIYLLMYLPAVFDFYQVATQQKPDIDLILLLYALIPSLIGSFVRVASENQKAKVEIKRKFYIIICSIALSYVVYVLVQHFNIINLISMIALIMGIISVDIVHWIINDLIRVASDFLRYTLMKDKNNSEKDGNPNNRL